MADDSRLSPMGAVIAGLFCMLLGAFPLLGALGVMDLKLAPGTPPWVGVAAGLLFVLAGLTLMNSWVIKGPPIPNDEWIENVSPLRAIVHLVLGTTICLLLAAIALWVGFGPGEREFSTGISLPFYSSAGKSSNWIGRAVFGVGGILTLLMAMVIAVSGIRRMKR